jgi:hypothetical protein
LLPFSVLDGEGVEKTHEEAHELSSRDAEQYEDRESGHEAL